MSFLSDFLYEPNLLVPGRQPVGSVKVRRGHKYAPDFCLLPQRSSGGFQIIDLVRRTMVALPASTTWENGTCRVSDVITLPAHLSPSGTADPYSFFMQVTLHSSASADLIVNKGTGTGNWRFQISSNTNKNLRFVKDISGTDLTLATSNNIYAVGEPFFAGVSADGGSGLHSLYANGELVEDTTGSTRNNPAEDLVFNGDPKDQAFEFLYFWTRRVPVGFFTELALDPYQVFTPANDAPFLVSAGAPPAESDIAPLHYHHRHHNRAG